MKFSYKCNPVDPRAKPQGLRKARAPFQTPKPNKHLMKKISISQTLLLLKSCLLLTQACGHSWVYINLDHWPVHVVCLFTLCRPSDMILKRTQTFPLEPLTPGLCFCGRRANRKDNIVSEPKTKTSLLTLAVLGQRVTIGHYLTLKNVGTALQNFWGLPEVMKLIGSTKLNEISKINFKGLCFVNTALSWT